MLFSIIYCSVLFACWAAYHSGQGLIGRHVRVQHEWNGPLVSSMDRERLFCLTVFPLLGTERTSSGPALAQCIMLIPLNVLLCIGIPTRTVVSGVTWHGEWNHLEKSHPLISTIGKDLILWYKQICIHLTYNSKSCQSGHSTAAAGVSQGGKKGEKHVWEWGKNKGSLVQGAVEEGMASYCPEKHPGFPSQCPQTLWGIFPSIHLAYSFWPTSSICHHHTPHYSSPVTACMCAWANAQNVFIALKYLNNC